MMYYHGITKLKTERNYHMDLATTVTTITTAVVAALSAGATEAITDTTKTAISEKFNKLKDLLVKKFGAHSEVVQTVEKLEAKPESQGYQQVLQESLAARKTDLDEELVAAANQILILVKSQQTSQSNITIHQDHANIQGQNIGDHQHITQHFGKIPEA
jgi:hypothetical protein